MNVAARALSNFSDRRLFLAAALGIITIVFAGFARTYFLRGFFFRDPLPLLLHVHGAVMFGWFALFFVQTCLVEAHRIRLHRRLGVLGGALATAMVILGPYVAFHAAARDVHVHTEAARFSLVVLGYDCAIIALFAGLVACAVAMRGRGDFHKRLMLLATLSLLTPAIARLPFMSNVQAILAGDVCVLACVITDVRLQRRLHPVPAVGGSLILVVTCFAYVGVQTAAWMGFATRLVS